MIIEILQKQDEEKWDEYVLSSPQADCFHLLAWRDIIKESYGYDDLYLTAKQDGKITGVLPLMYLRSKAFGGKMISLPFCSYGGILADDLETENILLEGIDVFAKQKQISACELRSLKYLPGLKTDESQYTFILDLEQGEEGVWANMDKKGRNQIRKAEKNDFVFLDTGNYLDDFYVLYQKNMKRLGTPVHSRGFMKKTLDCFGDSAKILLVKKDDKFVAGLFLLFFKQTAYNLWAASDSNYASMNPNNILYWETIKYCIDKKLKYFDFGRSQIYSGTYHFKEQWGGEAKKLFYQFPLSGKSTGFSAKKEKYHFAASIWRLMPLALANHFGPRIRKYFP